jgi:hypothetical protein
LSITCSSQGGATQTALGVLRASYDNWLYQNWSGTPNLVQPSYHARSSIPSTSNIPNNYNLWSGRELTKPLIDKTHDKKLSSEDTNVSEKSSRNGSAFGGRSKGTLFAAGTSASENIKKFSQQSLSRKGKHNSAVCVLLCEHINELHGPKNGGRFFLIS